VRVGVGVMARKCCSVCACVFKCECV